MSITVRYFAGLRERMGRDQEEVDVPGTGTVADVWARASGGERLPENVLTAVNQQYVAVDHAVKDGDEVAFFPPVTGG